MFNVKGVLNWKVAIDKRRGSKIGKAIESGSLDSIAF